MMKDAKGKRFNIHQAILKPQLIQLTTDVEEGGAIGLLGNLADLCGQPESQLVICRIMRPLGKLLFAY